MSNPVAEQARHPGAFLPFGVHLRFRFLGRPGGAGGAGLAKRYQLGVLSRMTLRRAPDRSDGTRRPGWDGSRARRISVSGCSLNAILGGNH
jgi:hypothetical protein